MIECPDILKNKDFIVFDLETTGVNMLFSTIIEIGCIEVEHGKIKREYTTLFGGGRSPVYLVRKVHKIKDIERRGKPTFKERAEKIADFFSNKILVGHNIKNFDIIMMQTKLNECGFHLENIKIIDTLTIARKIGHESNTLENLSKLYNIERGEHHRGLDDARMNLDLLYVFAQKYPELILNCLK